MSPSFKIGGKERVDNLQSFISRNKVCGQAKDIGIVVTTGQISQRNIPAQGCTNTLMVVAGHGDSIAC